MLGEARIWSTRSGAGAVFIDDEQHWSCMRDIAPFAWLDAPSTSRRTPPEPRADHACLREQRHNTPPLVETDRLHLVCHQHNRTGKINKIYERAIRHATRQCRLRAAALIAVSIVARSLLSHPRTDCWLPICRYLALRFNCCRCSSGPTPSSRSVSVPFIARLLAGQCVEIW